MWGGEPAGIELESMKPPREPLRRRDKIIIGVIIVIFLFVFYVMLDANKYRAVVHIVEGRSKVGVNPTSERLDFGDLAQGTSMIRRVEIQNGTPIPMYIMIFKIGSISDLIDIDKNFFRLAPRSTEKIEFAMYIPASAQVDADYTGRVYLFKIPTFGF